MAKRGFADRRQLEEHTFHPAVTGVIVLLALFLGVYLPHIFPRYDILDLPLIIVIFFSVSRRSPVTGTLLGAIVGILQDLPTNQYIGVNGIAKAIVGYTAASIGLRVDVDNILTRTLFSFGFSLLQSIILFAVRHFLLGQPGYHLLWLHELLRATVTAIVAVPIFLLLDRTRSDA
jgi:rod shape-determining protein MreD